MIEHVVGELIEVTPGIVVVQRLKMDGQSALHGDTAAGDFVCFKEFERRGVAFQWTKKHISNYTSPFKSN